MANGKKIKTDQPKTLTLRGTNQAYLETAKHAIETHAKGVLDSLSFVSHDNPEREGVKDSPRRFASALLELCTPRSFNFTVFYEEDADDLVIVKDISFVSLCEHHVLPFMGRAVVGYIPHGGQIVGLSKLPRLVENMAKGLNNQERITRRVGKFLMNHERLQPAGVAVVMEATHTCMSIRGAKQACACTRTQFFAGVLKTDPTARAEFMAAVPASLL